MCAGNANNKENQSLSSAASEGFDFRFAQDDRLFSKAFATVSRFAQG